MSMTVPDIVLVSAVLPIAVLIILITWLYLSQPIVTCLSLFDSPDNIESFTFIFAELKHVSRTCIHKIRLYNVND